MTPQQMTFSQVCDLMPPDFGWNDPCTPALVQHIVEAVRALAAQAAQAQQPEPDAPIEPLKGWKLNHVQSKRGEGTAQIGYLDPEDDRFSPIVTVDTGLYYEPKQAAPLAVAILGMLEDAANRQQPPREGLTDAQVQSLIETNHFDPEYSLNAGDLICINWYKLGLREGERAHGIGTAGTAGAQEATR